MMISAEIMSFISLFDEYIVVNMLLRMKELHGKTS